MIYIVDANIAVKWAFQENFSFLADQVAKETLIAPDFILIESANVIWGKCRSGEIDKSRTSQCLLDIRNAFSYFVSTNTIHQKALEIAINLDHSIYDCIYLSTALHTNHPLITADQSFFQKVNESQYSNLIKWIEEIE